MLKRWTTQKLDEMDDCGVSQHMGSLVGALVVIIGAAVLAILFVVFAAYFVSGLVVNDPELAVRIRNVIVAAVAWAFAVFVLQPYVIKNSDARKRAREGSKAEY